MNVYQMIGATSTLILFAPVLLIIYFKLYKNVSLFTLCIYYLATGIYNLMVQGYIVLPTSYIKNFGTVLNYLDAPMMLTVLLFFCAVQWRKKVVYYSLAFFILYELIILALFRLSTESNVYVLLPGILMILVYSFFLFTRFGKTTVAQGKGLGHTLLLASISFSYGCFSFIYFMHYIQKTSAGADVFLLYYIALILSTITLSIGIIWISKWVQEIKELQVTRKELALFFSTQKV